MTQKKAKKMSIRLFIIRLIGYITLGLVIPMSFLIWRFNLFTQTSKLNIGGWGIVVIIFTTVFVSRLAKQAAEAMDSELFRQILKSICKVLMPLLAATMCIYAVGDFWQELMYFFIVLTVCEPIAYVLNPLPEYLKEKDDKGEKNKWTEIIGLFWDKKK